MIRKGMSDVQEAGDQREDKGVDFHRWGKGGVEETEVNEGGLEVFIPEEAVVGTLPEGDEGGGGMDVAVEGVGEIVGIGKIKWV